MSKSLTVLYVLLQVNFHASVIILLIVSALSLGGNDLFFTDQSELYGPLAANLRLMLFYLCLTEIAVYSYCRFSNNFQAIVLMGVFLLFMIGSLKFYGYVNQIPIDDNYYVFFLYLGLSHVLFGFFSLMQRRRL